MEYIYAAMLLHKAGQKIEETSINKVLEAAGVKPEPTRAKALVAALDGVDIDKAIKEASVVQVAAPAASSESKPEAKKEDEATKKVEESKKAEEQASAGLSALFG